MMRQYSLLDKVLMKVDQLLQPPKIPSALTRPSPAEAVPEAVLTATEKRHIAGLMRVNHAGEVCAQALYHGQAITANNPHLAAQFLTAAQEENDHLLWCQERLYQLNSQPSKLNSLWYIGALSLGTLAGIFGDRWNLAFLAETETQVSEHLQKHRQRLPQQDQKTQHILVQMEQDESQHAAKAHQAGAAELPLPIKWAMRLASKVMTTVAYWI